MYIIKRHFSIISRNQKTQHLLGENTDFTLVEPYGIINYYPQTTCQFPFLSTEEINILIEEKYIKPVEET